MQQDYFTIDNDKLYYSTKFFEDCLCDTLKKTNLRILEAKFVKAIGDEALVGEGSKYDPSIPNQIQGLHHYSLTLQEEHKEHELQVLVKSKTSMSNFVKFISALPKQCKLNVSNKRMGEFLWHFFENLDRREVGIMQQQFESQALQNSLPATYGLYCDEKNEEYVVIREMLINAEITSDYTDISNWDDATIKSALAGFAEFHSAYFNDTDKLARKAWMMKPLSTKTMKAFVDVLQAFLDAMKKNTSDLLADKDVKFHQKLLDTLPDWWGAYDALPKALTYADPQPRNIAMRLLEQGKKQLCLFDLETLEILPPQRDVVEFLIYVTTSSISDEQIIDYLEFYRKALARITGQDVDAQEHMVACRLSLYHVLIHRVAFQMAIIPVVARSDIQRVWQALQRYLCFFESM